MPARPGTAPAPSHNWPLHRQSGQGVGAEPVLEIARATSRIEIAAAVNADPIIFFICAPLSAEIPLHLPSDSRYARRRCAALIGAIAYHRRSRCIGRAWFEELATGRARSLQELAKRDDISWRYIRRHVRRF